MFKFYVIESREGQAGPAVWNTGNGWSKERPDAFEFATYADAIATISALRIKAPYSDVPLMAVVVEEEREDFFA